jgi:hypothetical protein
MFTLFGQNISRFLSQNLTIPSSCKVFLYLYSKADPETGIININLRTASEELKIGIGTMRRCLEEIKTLQYNGQKVLSIRVVSAVKTEYKLNIDLFREMSIKKAHVIVQTSKERGLIK